MADQENLSTEGALAVVQGDLLSLGAADQRDRRELDALSQRLAVVGEHRSAEIGRKASPRRRDQGARHRSGLGPGRTTRIRLPRGAATRRRGRRPRSPIPKSGSRRRPPGPAWTPWSQPPKALEIPRLVASSRRRPG